MALSRLINSKLVHTDVNKTLTYNDLALIFSFIRNIIEMVVIIKRLADLSH